MQARCMLPLWMMLLVTGCATTRVVRLDTGRGEVIDLEARGGGAPVELSEEEFKAAVAEVLRHERAPVHPRDAARELFAVDAREGSYLLDARTRRVRPLGAGEHLEEVPSEADAELTRAYLRWCERSGQRGDCLRLLVERPTLSGEGRYALAMAMAQGAVREEMLEAFKDMVDPHAMLAAALWTGTMYLILWTVPEPVSKGLAAVMTATLVVYLGTDTFWGLITGFRRLVEEADRARTFEELREAGTRYGKVMGRNAARAFAMLATVAIGNTAAGFASKVPLLPGSAQASMQAGARAGIALASVGEVQTVTVTGEAITLGVAPNAVAMSVRGPDATMAGPDVEKGHDHHIATNKWWTSSNDGGPWSPRFQRIFDKAGMSLNDPANVVNVVGHQGPHPQAYHQEVYARLLRATESCRTMQQCREALTGALQRLAQAIAKDGSKLNRLVTRSE